MEREARLAAAERGGVWGSLVGAGLGASLALAETLVGVVSGGDRPLDWWALLTRLSTLFRHWLCSGEAWGWPEASSGRKGTAGSPT